jgi:3-oxoacyl-[acyl-carrier protein] reductase
VSITPPASSLQGRTAIVTGASRGIGRGIARVFSQAGANLVLMARGQEGLDAVAGELDGDRTLAVAGDVTSAYDLKRVVGVARERFGRLDVLVHNAGIYPESALDDVSLEEWHEVIDTNLTSTLLAVQACAPTMREQKQGRIVLVSSITGVRVGYPGLSAYSATKAGMLGFMRTVALELAPFGITINGVEPGSIRTEGLAGLGEDAIALMIEHIPIGSLGEPEDIAHTALFLASDGARFITGQSVVVDGGQTLPEIPV